MSLFSKKEKWLTEDPKKASKAIASLNKAQWDELLRASSEAPVKEVADAAADILMTRIKAKTDIKDPFYIGRDELKAIASRGREDIAIEACRRLIWYTEDDVFVANKTPYPAVAMFAVEKVAKKNTIFEDDLMKIALSATGHDEAKIQAVKLMQQKKGLEEAEKSGPTKEIRDAASAKMAVIREAEDPETSPERLAELINNEPFFWVRYAVAGNPSTPSSVLEDLADDTTGNGGVRHAAAANPNTPPEVLARILKEGGWADETTRYCLAKNPSTPPDTLKELADDREEFIRDLAKKNPNYPS